METEFTPYASLAGGALIGLASVALMALAGRIMGATGILAGAVLDRPKGNTDWRWALLAGMASGPLVVLALTGQMPAVDVPVSLPMLLAGGLLVGIGVSYGGGCTSGHGVCGMARLSQRSIVATLTFMLATFATVYLVRHVLGA
jgi:uncharacterized membrane protein YedE/YeeE